jgi:RimJ/RimL family protein N-acetyltransferase
VRHDIAIEGLALRLRPITDADAALIVQFRSDEQRGRYLHPISLNVIDQLAWLARYYEREGEYYFVIERLQGSSPEGLISIYNIDCSNNSGEWGRWILRPGSLAATESAWLIYRCAFEELGLDSVYCRTVSANEKVVSFHDSCRIADRRLLPGFFSLHGQALDAVEHRVTRSAWSELSPRLEEVAGLIASRIKCD